MIHVKILFAALFFVVYFIDAARIPERIPIIDRKPFNCFFCLSVWVTFGLHFVPEIVVNILLTCMTAGLTVNPIKNLFRNINYKTSI
jgi:hypothetical protein